MSEGVKTDNEGFITECNHSYGEKLCYFCRDRIKMRCASDIQRAEMNKAKKHCADANKGAEIHAKVAQIQVKKIVGLQDKITAANNLIRRLAVIAEGAKGIVLNTEAADILDTLLEEAREFRKENKQ